MRVLALLVALPALAQPVDALRVGLGAGLLVPVDLQVEDRRPHVEPGPLVSITFDSTLGDGFDAGLFVHAGSFTAESREEQVNLFELGAALHYDLGVLQKGSLRVGGGLGYRRLFADIGAYDRVQGIALNVDGELTRPLPGGLVGMVAVGALSQPWGANGKGSVRWLPMPCLLIGAVF